MKNKKIKKLKCMLIGIIIMMLSPFIIFGGSLSDSVGYLTYNGVNVTLSNSSISTTTPITINNVSISSYSENGLWDNGLHITSDSSTDNNLIFTVNNEDSYPHFWIQSGAPTSASGISRSFMIVNQVESLQNSTNITSCSAYMDYASEDLKIDCNTTTTGADLLVGDDMQIVGDVWIKDNAGEWHFLTRELDTTDLFYQNTLQSSLNSSLNLSSNILSITETYGDNLIVNLEKFNINLEKNIDNITLTAGTNSSPSLNYIYYSNSTNPTLKTSGTYVEDTADVGQILLGDGKEYGSIIGSAKAENFVRGIYNRFYDSGTLYIDGFDINLNTSDINISTGTVRLLFEKKTNTKNHSLSSTGAFRIENNGTFIQFTDISNITTYSNGATISNGKYYNLVCGIVNTGNGLTSNQDGNMMCIVQNEPSSEYGKIIDAEIDKYNAINIFPSNNLLKKIFTPVLRVIVKKDTTSEIKSLSNGLLYFDLRGTSGVSNGNAPTPSITNHNELYNLDYASSGHTGFMSDTGDTATGNYIFNDNVTASYFIGNGSLLTGISSGGDLWSDAVYSSIIPDTDNTYDIGNLTNKIKDIYINGETHTDALYVESDTGFFINSRMTHNGDDDTYITFQTDSIYAQVGSVDFLKMFEGSSDYILWNTNSRDIDFTIRSDNDDNMFVIDSATDKLGIGTLTPSEKLDVDGNVNIQGNITSVDNIILSQDTTNHKIYDNSTCVIIEGDTSTFNIC